MVSRLRSGLGVASLALALAVPAAAQQTIAVSPPRKMNRRPQRAPSRERYKQIQQALRDRGYNPGPIDGRWGSKTAAALKRFERDNNLPADGKLDSLALITLGLGPKRLNSVAGAKQ